MATWGQRVGASLIDWIGPYIVAAIFIVAKVYVLGYLLYAVAFAFTVWNTIFSQGTTGFTVGKRIVGIKLVTEETGQVVGVGIGAGRYFLPVLGLITCGIANLVDLLFPLWDPKRQRIVDKILKTVVIVEKPPPGTGPFG